MQFTAIDLNEWPRAQIFHYFAKMAPTGYSVTVNLDITRLRAILHDSGFKFFPAYLWLVTKNLNAQTEFKTAQKDGVLGYYDTLTPLYATFHEDEHTFSLMWTAYNPDFRRFHEAYLLNQQRYGGCHGILSQPGIPPENAYTVSSVPWVEFTHFAVHSYENKPYYFPSVEAGKFFDQAGRTLMPISLTCHHAATDGYHISLFLTALQEDADNFHKYL